MGRHEEIILAYYMLVPSAQMNKHICELTKKVG